MTLYRVELGADLGLDALQFNEAGPIVSQIDDDGLMAADSSTRIPTQRAAKQYIDENAGAYEFVDLSDTPAAYTAANRILATNSVPDGVVETSVQVTTPTANRVTLQTGTTTADIQASLTISGDTLADQDLRQAANPTFASMTIAGKLNVGGLIDPTGIQCDPVAANPGDSRTLWFDSASGDMPRIGDSPVVRGPVGGVSSDSILRCDGTTGGLVKESAATIDDSGNIGGVANIYASQDVVASRGLSSDTGMLRGKAISGGTWWRVYQIAARTNDCCAITVHTKDVDTENVCVRKVAFGACLSSAAITAQNSVEMGQPANHPRVVALATQASIETLEISQLDEAGQSAIDAYVFQTFTAVTGKPLVRFWLRMRQRTSTTGPCRVYIRDGDGTAGTILYDSGEFSLPTLFEQIDFVPVTPVPMTASGTYTIHIPQAYNANIVLKISASNVYSGGYFSYGGTVMDRDCTFQVYTQATTDPVYDLYVYAQPEAASYSTVTIPISNTVPLWNDEGTGAWPSSHPTIQYVRFDSSDEGTYPPNTLHKVGTMWAQQAYSASLPTADTQLANKQYVDATCPIGYVYGYDLTVDSNTDITIGKAGQTSIARDDGGGAAIVHTGELSASIANTGPGGIQTGSARTVSTWYGVYVIGDSSGANATGVVFIPAGTAFSEPGYDLKRRVGWVHTGTVAPATFPEMYVHGKGTTREYQYLVAPSTNYNIRVLTGGTSTTFTTVDLADWVPSTTRYARVVIIIADGDPAQENILLRPTGTAYTVANTPYRLRIERLLNAGHKLIVNIPTNASQQIDYALSNADNIAQISVLGFRDDI